MSRPSCAAVTAATLGTALLLLTTTAAQPDPTFNLLPNPLELEGAFPGDYRNWAAVLAQVMLAAEGGGAGGGAGTAGDSPAVAALGNVLLATHARLAALAEAGPDATLFPRFHVRLDADKLGAAFGHHDTKAGGGVGVGGNEGGVGGGHHDPLWDAHMGLDHPAPPGCAGRAAPHPTGTPNMTDHHGDDHDAGDAGADADSEAGEKQAAPFLVGRPSARGPYPRLVPGAVVGGAAARVPRVKPAPSTQPTPPQAPQPAAMATKTGRALRQHDDSHATTPPPGGTGGDAHGGGHDDSAHAGGHDPCHSDTGHTSVHKLWASKAFINYAPCVLQEAAHGLHAQAAGLRFAPRLFEFVPTGLMAGLQGLNVAPSLIYFAPMGLNVQPQAVNIQPGLIYIGPMGFNAQPQGVNIQPIGTSVMPTGLSAQASKVLVAPTQKMVMPVKVLDSEVKGPVDAPVGVDLTPPGQGGHGGHVHGSEGGGVGLAGAAPDSATFATMPGMEGMTPDEHAAAMARGGMM